MDQFCILLNTLCASKAYEQHQQQLAGPQGSSGRAALGSVLTQCIWPCLADLLEHDWGCTGAGQTAGSSGGGGTYGSSSSATDAAHRTLAALTLLGQVFHSAQMRQAWRSAAFEPGSLAAGMRAAARLLLALPITPPPDAMAWGVAHATAAAFVGLSAVALLDQPGPRALWMHHWEAEQGGAATLSPGPAATRQLRQLEAEAAEGVEAAWVVLRLLPGAAAVAASLKAMGGSIWDDYAYYLGTALRLLQLLPTWDSVTQAGEWAAACQAMLRLLPLLCEVGASSESEEPGPQSDAHRLAGHILKHLWHDGASSLLEYTQSCFSSRRVCPNEDSLAALAELASAAHMTACRAVHAMAAVAAAGHPPGFWRDQFNWTTLAAGLNTCLTTAFRAQPLTKDTRRWGSICLLIAQGLLLVAYLAVSRRPFNTPPIVQ